MKILVYFLIILFLISCASSPKRVSYEQAYPDTIVEYSEEALLVLEEIEKTIDVEVNRLEHTYTRESPVDLSISTESTQSVAPIEIMLPAPEEPILSTGTLVYNLDSTFYYEQPSRVKVKVSNADLVEVTPELVTEFHPVASGGLIVNTIQTAEVMGMVLEEVIPGNVIIISLSSGDQLVEEGWTTWEWSVVPIKKGDCVLRLRAIVRNDGGVAKDIIVFEKNINVQVKDKIGWLNDQFHSALGKFKDYWFVLTVLLIPAATWIYRKRAKRKKLENN